MKQTKCKTERPMLTDGSLSVEPNVNLAVAHEELVLKGLHEMLRGEYSLWLNVKPFTCWTFTGISIHTSKHTRLCKKIISDFPAE